MSISNLQLILMGQLLNQRLTGYTLKQNLLNQGWKASHQQIYRELNKLRMFKLLDVEDVPQEGKPDKKLYQLTGLGQSELTEALDVEPGALKIQDEALAHLFLANAYYFEQLEQQLAERIDLICERLSSAEDTLASLAITRELEHAQAEYNWASRTLQELTAGGQEKAA